MEDGMDIEEHDLLNNPTVRSLFPDLAVLKQEIINFDTSEGVAPETFTTSPEVSKTNENKNQLHNLPVYSGDHPTECSTQDLDVKPDHLCTDMDGTITVKRNSLTEFDEVETEIKKESENVVANELLFYRNRIILGKIQVDESDEEREVDAPADCNNVVNNKTNNDADLAVSINSDQNRSMRITKQYYEMEKCLGAKIILTNCYTTLLNHNCYCAQCAVLFPTTEAYSEHYTSTHTETTNSTKASASPVTHKKRNNPREKVFVCDTCKKTCDRKSMLIKHMLVHTGERPFECDICKKTFNQRSAMKRHKLIHTGEKPFECDLCKKTFRHQNTWKDHKLIHTGEKPFQCDICMKSFIQRYTLNRHMLHHTESKPFQCETCRKKFKYVSALKRHKLIHSGEKPFQCEICTKSFNHRDNLRSHKLIHSGEKPFQCEICKKTYRHLSTMKVHKLIHTEEKPFQCEICTKSFNHRNNLNRHKLVHSSEKPFQCEFCTKTFNRRCHLKRHMLLHTAAQPYDSDASEKM
ncbi:zinc finger protein 85-like [Plutella xylostella]|uniref:zinc finger protein 85-like n=1 Tax=Plutella xylostella TaxID=51655 RepID=UPI0020322FF3|nr:zinc finger protein 85-like [Plutella xylostella]